LSNETDISQADVDRYDREVVAYTKANGMFVIGIVGNRPTSLFPMNAHASVWENEEHNLIFLNLYHTGICNHTFTFPDALNKYCVIARKALESLAQMSRLALSEGRPLVEAALQFRNSSWIETIRDAGVACYGKGIMSCLITKACCQI
jgi:hypothetical protein